MIDLLCTVYMICWFSLCNQFPSSFQYCSFYSLSCCYFYFSSFTCQFYCIRTSKTLTHLIAFLNAHIHQVDATGTLRISVQLLLNFVLMAQMPKFWLKHGVLAHTSHMKQYSWVKHSQVSELCSEPGQLMQLVWACSNFYHNPYSSCLVCSGHSYRRPVGTMLPAVPWAVLREKLCGSGVLA